MRLHRALLLAGLLVTQAATAASLQISPVSIKLQKTQTSSGITLQNMGAAPIYGQVRVFAWDQDASQDLLTATTELVASPPIVMIAPGASQVVRLVRTGAAGQGERSFRVLIDEVARDTGAAESGVDIRLRYSVPVFVQAGAGVEVLRWTTFRKDGQWMLRVANQGSGHAQIGTLKVRNSSGASFAISKGLFGYVLAGRTREWPLQVPAAADLAGPLSIDALINARAVVASSVPAQ